MNDTDWDALRYHRDVITREERIQLKEDEIERLSYNGMDILDIMIHLEGLRLFWY
jgi:hypothetical protein